MNCPKKVYVSPHTYVINVCKSGLLSSAERSGQTRHEELVIDIDGTHQAHTQFLDTLLHEVLHCLFQPQHLNDDHEEHLIRGLAPALLGFLRDNPSFVEYLQS